MTMIRLREKVKHIDNLIASLPDERVEVHQRIDIFAPANIAEKEYLSATNALQNISVAARSITASIQPQFASEKEHAIFAAAAAVENAADLTQRHLSDSEYKNAKTLLKEAIGTLKNISQNFEPRPAGSR